MDLQKHEQLNDKLLTIDRLIQLWLSLSDRHSYPFLLNIKEMGPFKNEIIKHLDKYGLKFYRLDVFQNYYFTDKF